MSASPVEVAGHGHCRIADDAHSDDAHSVNLWRTNRPGRRRRTQLAAVLRPRAGIPIHGKRDHFAGGMDENGRGRLPRRPLRLGRHHPLPPSKNTHGD